MKKKLLFIKKLKVQKLSRLKLRMLETTKEIEVVTNKIHMFTREKELKHANMLKDKKAFFRQKFYVLKGVNKSEGVYTTDVRIKDLKNAKIFYTYVTENTFNFYTKLNVIEMMRYCILHDLRVSLFLYQTVDYDRNVCGPIANMNNLNGQKWLNLGEEKEQ